jgi:hypothetical protein
MLAEQEQRADALPSFCSQTQHDFEAVATDSGSRAWLNELDRLCEARGITEMGADAPATRCKKAGGGRKGHAAATALALVRTFGQEAGKPAADSADDWIRIGRKPEMPTVEKTELATSIM